MNAMNIESFVEKIISAAALCATGADIHAVVEPQATAPLSADSTTERAHVRF